MPEAKKIVRVMCDHGNAYEVVTVMTADQLVDELEHNSSEWVHLAGLNEFDEPTPATILRADIRGWLVIPWHAQRPPQQVGPPRIVQ